MNLEVKTREDGKVSVVHDEFGVIAILDSDWEAQNWIESSAEEFVNKTRQYYEDKEKYGYSLASNRNLFFEGEEIIKWQVS